MFQLLASITILIASMFSNVVPATPAYAQSSDDDTIVLGYMYDTEPPIPVGTLVTVNVIENHFTVTWLEQLQNGYVKHTYWMKDVAIIMMNGKHGGFPHDGEQGFIREYEGYENHIVQNLYIDKAIFAPAQGLAVSYVDYMNEDRLPFPIGSVVTFFDIAPHSEGTVGIEWDEQMENPVTNVPWFYKHGFAIDSRVTLVFDEVGASAHRQPKAGDKGVFVRYDRDDHGTLVNMQFVEYAQLEPWNERVLRLGQEFYQEALDQHFALTIFEQGTDCVPDEILVNGKPAQKGPYGRTIMLPIRGATVSGWYEKDRECNYGGPQVRWSYFAKPGDVLGGSQISWNEGTIEMIEAQPLCSILIDLRPQWQPETLPNGADSCVFEKSDTNVLPTMARLGFDNAYGVHVPSIGTLFLPQTDTSSIALPAHRWVNTNYLLLSSGDAYTATWAFNGRYGENVVQLSSIGADPNDIALELEPGNLIVYVPDAHLMSSGFTWIECEVYRVVRIGFESIQVQQIVWLNN